jgi:hypothetical protein
MDHALVKSELAMYGILLDGQQCVVVEDGQEKKFSASDYYQRLVERVKIHKSLAKELWGDLMRVLSSPPPAINAGSSRTGRMFTETVKHLYAIASRSRRHEQHYLKKLLGRDINAFSETFMSKAVDLKVGLDWVVHLARADEYRMKLMRALAKINHQEKEASVSGPWANLDLPSAERVWSYEDERENLEDEDQEKQKQLRYQIPDSYNDPYEFEEGFYYRELRNEPYAWDDEENNPYPHRDLLWDDA